MNSHFQSHDSDLFSFVFLMFLICYFLRAGSNVLIGKCTCNCSDFLYCTCPEDSKCQVWLSDFDSVMVTKQPRKSSKMPVVLDGVKRRMVFGTPGCRAPEVL